MWVQYLGGEDPLKKEMGNPLQYSCLENPMDRGAWRVMVHGILKSRTQLKGLRTDRCSIKTQIELLRVY